MRRLLANRGVQAGVFGVVMFVTSFTSRDGWTTAVVVGLIASLGWFTVFTWLDRPPR
jgi:hypothetical protein